MRRVFFGLRFSSKFQSALSSSLDELRTTSPSAIRWTAKEDYHLTLLFLGMISDDRYEILRQMSFDQELLPTSYDLEFDGIGFFPSQDKAKIAWLGIKAPSQALTELNTRLCKVFTNWIDPRKSETFKAHITIARASYGIDPNLFEKIKLNFRKEPIHEFYLYESLGDQNPRYQIRSIYPLPPK